MRTLLAVAIVSAALSLSQQRSDEVLKKPDDPEMNQRAPDECRILVETSKGPMTLEMRRAWSPHGADRFYNLVRHGYFDEARFFRVRPATWVQFGISADPAIATIWRTRTIPDDPRVLSNTRGTVAFAFKDPNGRTTQVFINLKDNSSTHDTEPFVPFARVVDGMQAADAFYSEYGEKAGGGIRGGKQDQLFAEGNAFLMREFPKLDFIRRARVVSPRDH